MSPKWLKFMIMKNLERARSDATYWLPQHLKNKSKKESKIKTSMDYTNWAT